MLVVYWFLQKLIKISFFFHNYNTEFRNPSNWIPRLKHRSPLSYTPPHLRHRSRTPPRARHRLPRLRSRIPPPCDRPCSRSPCSRSICSFPHSWSLCSVPHCSRRLKYVRSDPPVPKQISSTILPITPDQSNSDVNSYVNSDHTNLSHKSAQCH